MTRTQYALHITRRIIESLLIAGAAATLADLFQRGGWLAPWTFGGRSLPGGGRWNQPVAWALIAHLLLGPKQRRPVLLRIPGAMYVYAGIPVDRQAGCRGGLTTGSTGSGKTQCCLLPRLYSLCVNERGTAASASNGSEGTAPWGGLVCGEKGNEWETVGTLLRHHERSADLRLLAARPSHAGPEWKPAVRLNLLHDRQTPAATYAQILVDTGLAVEDARQPDDFFITQAREQIAAGIRLLRLTVNSEGFAESGLGCNLVALDAILTSEGAYRRVVTAFEADPRSEVTAQSRAWLDARRGLEENYWSQPPDQLGGVRSTVHNLLGPYVEPDIAEIFCTTSTFDLRDIERGAIVCLALPQRHAVGRRYVTTLLKYLVYRIILERFDRARSDPAWTRSNVIVVEQDEWQRYAVRADCEIDVVREAQGAMYGASQTQNALWIKYGGRERASALLANLRNRWICQSASEECAEESARLLSERRTPEVTRSSGPGGPTTAVSYTERPILSKARLRTLPPFHVCFVPAEGRWLYRLGIAMPITPDGQIPRWWFGEWNLLRLAAWIAGVPESIAGLSLWKRREFIPPWRARAPFRAQWRRLWGLDGTFIVLEQMSARKALRSSGVKFK